MSSGQQGAVTEIHAVTAHTLLLAIDNEPFGNGKVDQSHNGLWAIHTDGTSLTRLIPSDPISVTLLNGSSQFPWSNVSRDGTMYAATQVNYQHHAYAIIIGSLDSGTPKTIASISDGTTLDIAGWTIM